MDNWTWAGTGPINPDPENYKIEGGQWYRRTPTDSYLNQMPRSILDLPGHQLYLADQIAQSSRNKQIGLESFLPILKSGITVEDIRMEEEKYDALSKQIEQEIATAPQMPQPTQPNMSIGQGISGLLGAILDPQHAAQNVGAALQGPVQQAGKQDQYNMAAYEQELQKRKETISFLMSQQDDESKKIADMLKQKWEREQLEVETKLKVQQLEQGAELNRENRLSREQNQRMIDESRWRDDFRMATTVGEKESIGARMVEKGLMDPKTVEASLTEFKDRLSKEYLSVLKPLMPDGFVYGENLPQAELIRQSYIAKGVDPALLPIPTEKTYKAQLQEAKLKEMAEQFKYIGDEAKSKIAKRLADIDIAQKRLDVARINAGTSQGNLNMRMREFELREHEAKLKEDIKPDVKKLESDISQMKGQIDSMKARKLTNTNEYKKAVTKRDGMEADLRRLKALYGIPEEKSWFMPEFNPGEKPYGVSPELTGGIGIGPKTTPIKGNPLTEIAPGVSYRKK